MELGHHRIWQVRPLVPSRNANRQFGQPYKSDRRTSGSADHPDLDGEDTLRIAVHLARIALSGRILIEGAPVGFHQGREHIRVLTRVKDYPGHLAEVLKPHFRQWWACLDWQLERCPLSFGQHSGYPTIKAYVKARAGVVAKTPKINELSIMQPCSCNVED
jgi:hypothetical protein